MRRFTKLLLFCILLFRCALAHAQDRPVTGVIRDDDDQTPIVGVTVTIKGTTRASQTDAHGSFTILAKKGDVLLLTYVGYERREVTVGDATSITIRLKSADKSLGEVVVTAMDIKRNPRELGYSVQKVDGKEVAETQRENFLNSLQGRVAGLTVTPSGGTAGASSQIVLRGFNSMALDNQPLFVVDGIIVDNQTINETSNGGSALGLASDRANRNNDYTNRVADINPTDIESLTILKGPEATALYGSQASSGAIVITTRKGKSNGKLLFNYDNSFRMQKLTRFPEVSNKFNSGNNGLYETGFTYFGPAYEADVKTYDNVHAFFQTGFAQTHNLSAEYGKKNYTFRFSGSAFDQSGTIPNNDFKRYNLKIVNTTKIGKYIDITPQISYIRSTNDKPLRGASGYLLNLLRWPVDNDVRNWSDASGNKLPLYSANANGEIDNPFFNVYKNRSYDQTDRLLSSLGININPFSWLSIAGRFGYDTYRSTGYTFYHPTSYYLTRAQGGALDNYYRNYYGYNHTITATAKKTIGNWSGRIMVGTMWQDYKTKMFSVYGTNLIDSVSGIGQMYKNGAIVPEDQFVNVVGDPTDSSSTRPSTRVRLSNARKGLYNTSISRQVAYFAEASISYKNFAFLTYSHRFEESSIFPKDYRNYNYPAASLSLIISDMIPAFKQSKILDFLKIRGSVAGTARSSSPYRNQSVFNTTTGSGGGYAYAFDNNNYYLEPERQQTFETGFEARFLNNLIGIDATYYNTLNKKQIVEGFRSSYGTGFVLNTLNVGTTRNQGVEISMDLNPVQRGDFRWNIRLNFNHMWNKVLELPANVPEFYQSDTWLYGNARGGLIVGGSTTGITSYGYARNNKGDILIDPANGLPVLDATFKLRGDRNPDFTLGTLNNFSYKNWNLSFLWDWKVGGDIFNGTNHYLTTVGKSTRTDDRKTPRVIKGVLNDGLQNSSNPTVNTIVVTPYDQQAYYTTRMPEEEFIEKDVNWLRLRDITLSYTFTGGFMRKAKHLRSLSVFATGNDLLLFTNYTGADPAVNGNTAGSRGVGGFGFDYGNVGTPISVNVGLRVGF